MKLLPLMIGALIYAFLKVNVVLMKEGFLKKLLTEILSIVPLSIGFAIALVLFT